MKYVSTRGGEAISAAHAIEMGISSNGGLFVPEEYPRLNVETVVKRGFYEGIAFALNSCAEIISEYGTPITSMMLAGGGARSGLWPDILAAVFGMSTRVHKAPGECTSLGAAILAGVGAGIFSSYEDACAVVKARSSHPVNPGWEKAYAEIYPIYHDIYDRVHPLTDRIAQLGAGG